QPTLQLASQPTLQLASQVVPQLAIDSERYLAGLEQLQYDLLYGERYAYGGEDLYPATDLIMDVEDISISEIRKNEIGQTLAVYGSNFTKNTKVFVNGERVATTYVTPSLLTVSLDSVSDGDVITINTIGSKSIVLRAGTNEVIYKDPA
ncbi:MAG: IPT/TIG domain-containing protein, partial [Clostridiales bacterium]|nr:IPT/TIG domain-containing protein [Clostridiales bacterium]